MRRSVAAWGGLPRGWERVLAPATLGTRAPSCWAVPAPLRPRHGGARAGSAAGAPGARGEERSPVAEKRSTVFSTLLFGTCEGNRFSAQKLDTKTMQAQKMWEINNRFLYNFF